MMKIYKWVNCGMKHDHDVTPKLELKTTNNTELSKFTKLLNEKLTK